MGRDDAAAGLDSDRYVSFKTLANFGRSTGLPLRKKNCRSVAARPDPMAALETYLHMAVDQDTVRPMRTR